MVEFSDAEFVSGIMNISKKPKKLKKDSMNQKTARNLSSLEYQFEKIRIKLEKYKDVAPDDINRTIVDELFDKIVIEPPIKPKLHWHPSKKWRYNEKRGFPICRSENIALTI